MADTPSPHPAVVVCHADFDGLKTYQNPINYFLRGLATPQNHGGGLLGQEILKMQSFSDLAGKQNAHLEHYYEAELILDSDLEKMALLIENMT